MQEHIASPFRMQVNPSYAVEHHNEFETQLPTIQVRWQTRLPAVSLEG